MKKIFCALSALAICAATVCQVHAQDPVKAAPDSYKLQFENDLVKVLRVNYAARAKVPVHDHSRSPAAYVYLTDSGPIHFRHAHWDDPVLTRRAVTAGSFRLSPTRFGDETHEAENPGDLASSFLRIEFKYLPIATTSVVGRYPREQFAVNREIKKVHFDNENLRVTRHILGAGQTLKLDGSDPALTVIVFADKVDFSAGQTLWTAAGSSLELKNSRNGRLEILRFDLKGKR